MINVVFWNKYIFFLENPVFSANFAKFDFTNTVIIMVNIGSRVNCPSCFFSTNYDEENEVLAKLSV